MHVIYPPVRDVFAPQDEATRAAWRGSLGIREPRVVLNVKRLHELAGQRYLIEAFARAIRDRDDVRLVICGTGALQAELEAQARHARVGRYVTFTGLVSNDTVAKFAAIADLFVLPSLLEAMPTVAVEALASGTPVLSADHPGGVELHELFGDDVALVPMRNSDALARGLDVALAQPRRVHDSTLQLVRRHFGQERVDDAYRAVYAELLQAGS
jgi:glycosyltransferase involved in cell wall biosynthesis